MRLYVALGATLEGARLAGQSEELASGEPGAQRYLAGQLFAADLDGDGFDEVIAAGRSDISIYDLEP